MAEVIRLTAIEWAWACLEAARDAETDLEAAELLERHRRLMRKKEIEPVRVGEPAPARVRQLAGA